MGTIYIEYFESVFLYNAHNNSYRARIEILLYIGQNGQKAPKCISRVRALSNAIRRSSYLHLHCTFTLIQSHSQSTMSAFHQAIHQSQRVYVELKYVESILYMYMIKYIYIYQPCADKVAHLELTKLDHLLLKTRLRVCTIQCNAMQ